MAITAEQKADAGQRFINTIKERIAIREKKQKEQKEKEHSNAQGELLKLARAWWAEHDMPGKVASASFDTERLGGYESPRLEVIDIIGEMAKVTVEARWLNGAKELREATQKASILAADLCKELSFLHEQLDCVAAFQAHVSRLWAPSGKGVLLSEAHFKSLVEDFLMAKRPAVCAL